MTLKLTKVRVCDICKAEWDEHIQELTARCIEQIMPHSAQNQLTYGGYTYDLCLMCMAPVHHAFQEQVRKVHPSGLTPPDPSNVKVVAHELSGPMRIKRLLP